MRDTGAWAPEERQKPGSGEYKKARNGTQPPAPTSNPQPLAAHCSLLIVHCARMLKHRATRITAACAACSDAGDGRLGARSGSLRSWIPSPA